MALLCLMLACCQKVDWAEPKDTASAEAHQVAATIVGTGEGTMECPYTVADIRALGSSGSKGSEAIWVIGYMVGTARQAMSNAVFSIDATNQSNILLSFDSLCCDTACCIPIELSSAKNRSSFSLPTNVEHFRKCLIIKGIPSTYLNRKGLRNVSAGLWMDGFDISSVAPQQWGEIILQQP